MIGELHICTGDITDENDPMYGKKPKPIVIHEKKWDFRCQLNCRVYEGKYRYDGIASWEVARFLRSADADTFLGLLQGKILAVEACVLDAMIKRLNELDSARVLKRDGGITVRPTPIVDVRAT